MSERLRIVLISPKGPLYRRRGGIFKQSLRYMPLTLPTLAALIPDELNAEVVCVDEGIADVDLDLDADLIGMTVITGTAVRAYELARHFRQRGITVVLGGPHVTLVPDDAQPNADSIVVGYAEEEWPRLLRDFAEGDLRPRYTQSPTLDLAGFPLPDRNVLPRSRYLTADVFEATRGCTHNCSFCVVPSAWGRKPLQKPVEEVVADIRRRRARRAIFVDLNLIADKQYAVQLFEALIPLKIHWYGLATTLLCQDLPLLDLVARSGCRGLLMGFESLSRSNLGDNQKPFNNPDNFRQIVERLHEREISLQGCFVFGLDDDTPDVFLETARFAVEAGIDLPRFAIVTPFPGTSLYERLESEDRILTKNWELYDGQHVVFQPSGMSVEQLQQGNEMAWKYAYSWGGIARRLRKTPASWSLALLTNMGYRYYAHRLHKFYTCDWTFDRPAPPPIDWAAPIEPDVNAIQGVGPVSMSTASEQDG
ncbi:MAG: B12-binding domain-containing radical SAM protein [Planctomycetes bacterium]|nr:B12-binding domain-containing radical SAM protein [Planctomycetota bacterium]